MDMILFIGTDTPMHWSIAGIIIGLVVPTLLVVGNKNFGVSSTLRHLCAIALPADKGYFGYDVKSHYWSLLFILGIGIGGVASHLHHPNVVIETGAKTVDFLNENNIQNNGGLYPTDLFNTKNTKGLLLLIIGGFLVGFGTRYANGCTSGHSIFGLANFQLSSLIATISFFIGGLLMTYFLLPYLL